MSRDGMTPPSEDGLMAENDQTKKLYSGICT